MGICNNSMTGGVTVCGRSWAGRRKRKIRAIRELNPGPLVPETRIIPLDQSPSLNKH